LELFTGQQIWKGSVFSKIALVHSVRTLLLSEGRKAEDPFGD
jgi:hypothetical protein